MKTFIFVMDSNWHLFGIPEQDKTDWNFYVLRKCGTIRHWGTTSGLGQLALEGRQESTIIDPEPDGVRINKLYIHRMIPCTHSSWDK